MTTIDLFAFDRTIAAAVSDVRAERRSLSTREGALLGAQPVARRVASKAALAELSEQAASPLATELAAWVRELTVSRVTAADRALAAQARFGEEASIDGSLLSLFARNANVVAIENQICEAAPVARDARRLNAERVREASRLLTIDTRTEAQLAHALAEQVLRVTEPAFERDGTRSWSAPFRRALAADAGEGWPVHISTRWLASLFERGELLRGLSLDVGTLPAPLGASSFARALGSLGEALAFADLPPEMPFCLARSPGDPLLARRAALFAGLVLEPSFFKRKLGLGGPLAREQAARVARAAVVWVRTAAFRVLAQPLIGAEDGGRDFEELAQRALGVTLPAVLLGVVPKLSDDDGRALVGLASAANDRKLLRERFDDDWFDNPRAHEALRHEHHTAHADRPKLATVEPDGTPRAVQVVAQAGAQALIDRLREALDE